MARFEFKLPDIGEGVAEAEIVEWLVEVGDAVKEGQAIVAVMTDKATVEMEAPAEGVILERHGDVGAMMPVGTVLFTLETGEELPSEAPGSGQDAQVREQRPTGSTPQPSGTSFDKEAGKERHILASPAVRKRARTLGIDLSTIATSGAQVRHEDLDRYFLEKGTKSVTANRKPLLHGVEQPVTGLRRQIARRMQEAKQHIPHFTFVDELDVTALEQHRADLNRQRGERPPLHFLPFLVAAMCRALRDFPMLNAHYDDAREVLIRFEAVHVGIATQTEGGLMVPVLRDANGMDVWQIAEGIARLAARARSGEIGSAELSGSTITVSSLGKLGGIAATPIVNRPEVAILAPHRVIDRPVLIDGGIEPRKIMNLSISCDHRVVDGYTAAAFVQAIRQTLTALDFLSAA